MCKEREDMRDCNNWEATLCRMTALSSQLREKIKKRKSEKSILSFILIEFDAPIMLPKEARGRMTAPESSKVISATEFPAMLNNDVLRPGIGVSWLKSGNFGRREHSISRKMIR